MLISTCWPDYGVLLTFLHFNEVSIRDGAIRYYRGNPDGYIFWDGLEMLAIIPGKMRRVHNYTYFSGKFNIVVICLK